MLIPHLGGLSIFDFFHRFPKISRNVWVLQTAQNALDHLPACGVQGFQHRSCYACFLRLRQGSQFFNNLRRAHGVNLLNFDAVSKR